MRCHSTHNILWQALLLYENYDGYQLVFSGHFTSPKRQIANIQAMLRLLSKTGIIQLLKLRLIGEAEHLLQLDMK